MLHRIPRLALLQIFLLTASLAAAAQTELRLPAIFSDHAVLQRSKDVAVWGWAQAGQTVTVALGEAQAAAVADADGKWRVSLDLHKPYIGHGPHRLIVQAGRERCEIEDVLVGQVWLCSGQSNMEFRLVGAIGGDREIAKVHDYGLRQFLAKKIQAPAPRDDCAGEWMMAQPENSGEFSAVAWFFGKNLRGVLGAPVGLINASWGGTACEFWMSDEALGADPELREGRDARLAERAELPGKQKAFREALDAWTKNTGRENAGVEKPPADAKWTPVRLPGADALAGAGVVWLRRKIQIVPREDIGLKRAYSVVISGVTGFETVYWDGRRIGGVTPAGLPLRNVRSYSPFGIEPPAGENAELMLRLYSPLDAISLQGTNGFNAGALRMDGDWEMWVERTFPEMDAKARAEFPKEPPGLRDTMQPSGIYNGMIHPLRTYAMRGVIWYQGETNAPRAAQYRNTFAELIRDWRRQCGNAELPFYFCQLASHHAKPAGPGDVSTWAELRESQAHALALPHTGMAVLVDIGEEKDIHPRNKADVGARLARLTLASNYGRTVPASGPVFEAAAIENGAMRVRFRETSGGLVAQKLPATYQPRSLDEKTVPLKRNAPFGELEGFAICDADGRWHWAGARIEGNEVVVSAPEAPRPIAVRYGWADNPTCNLYNGAGLPAAPFRTDDFPLSTKDKRY